MFSQQTIFLDNSIHINFKWNSHVLKTTHRFKSAQRQTCHSYDLQFVLRNLSDVFLIVRSLSKLSLWKERLMRKHRRTRRMLTEIWEDLSWILFISSLCKPLSLIRFLSSSFSHFRDVRKAGYLYEILLRMCKSEFASLPWFLQNISQWLTITNRN